MRRAGDRRRQLCAGIALRRIELGLGEKDAVAEVGTSEVGSPQVSPDEVSHPQIGASEVSSDEVRASQAGGSEVGTPEIGADEVGSSAVDLLAPGFASHELARMQQQSIDVSSVCCQVQFHDSVGTEVSEAFGLVERGAELAVSGRRSARRLSMQSHSPDDQSHARDLHQ
jgi:hypothetical protein